jgi:hypothetical protein
MARIGGSLLSGGKGAESTRMATYRMEQCFACVKSKDFSVSIIQSKNPELPRRVAE